MVHTDHLKILHSVCQERHVLTTVRGNVLITVAVWYRIIVQDHNELV